MQEIIGNLWDLHDQGFWIGIPTNGNCRRDGRAVMGAGVALAAANRFPNLPILLGGKLRASGNHAYYWHEFRLVTLPTKEAWTQPSTLGLIERTAREAVRLADHYEISEIYCPRLGCGLGCLPWNEVAAVLARLWDDRFIIVHPSS
jgi:hypothetical protein